MSALEVEVEETVLYHDTCHHKIYGLSCEQFDELHAYAEGRCQICQLPEADAKRGRLCIDHLGDYGQRAVRGLLCDACNTMMSYVDNRDTARHMIDRWAVSHYQSNAWFVRQLLPESEVLVLPSICGPRGQLIRDSATLIARYEFERDKRRRARAAGVLHDMREGVA